MSEKTIARDVNQFEITSLSKIRGQKKGISKMLEIESAPLRTPRFIPDSAYSVSFVNLNIKKDVFGSTKIEDLGN